jgi:hypothetical protein
VLTGRRFFPGLISAPFQAGLHAAFDFAIVASLLAAGASWLRGGRYVYSEPESESEPAGESKIGARASSALVSQDDVSSSSIAQVEAG